MKTKLAILYFTNAHARGGAEEHILTLLRGLDRDRYCASLVCSPSLAELMSPDVPADVALYRLRFDSASDLAAARRFARIIKESGVDLVHSHLFYSSLFGSPLAWLCRVPAIVETPHLSERWRHGWKSSFFIDRTAGRFVDYYIAVSHANARYLIETKRLPQSKVVVIHNGSDMHRFDPARLPSAELKRSLGFDTSDPVLISLARLEPQKGHAVLLEAFAMVRRQVPNARLVCVGEGSLRNELEQRAAGLGLNDSVQFVGYQTNTEDWLALADATVLSSFYEGLPLVAIESLAAGRPVIATAVDGTPEIVVNGKCGLTVPPGDAAALATAICQILTNVELRRTLGQRGAKWVRENFDQKQQVEKTQELYVKAWETAKRGRAGREWIVESRAPEGRQA